ncbi:MAG: alanine--tRNA ligase, partial [Nitrosospira sp.]
MKSSEIRQQFLEFFESHGHTVVASSPLVPANDPTLLFTNAGMVQFKEVFLGQDRRPYVRAASSQRCVRAGGKHNDLENVGYTARHHTFFEMLGNFSFGDYFKRNAIKFAWEFLTVTLKVPQEKLWITVYAEDDEAADIWLNEVGVAPSRFTRIATMDNFWQMGDTGPCGPCSEIFYDHGPEIAGGPPGTADADGDRYVEIWNLVFMQYNRDSTGTLHPLPKPSVDTGMGLERIAAVMQQVHSNYEIDLFQELIKAAARDCYGDAGNAQDLSNNSLKVIADHIRECSFLIVDGVIPGNEGRGYVLRRIIRRAIRHGYKLGQNQPFFYSLVEDLAKTMGSAYPELVEGKARIAAVLKHEEERFAETLENGMQLLEYELHWHQILRRYLFQHRLSTETDRIFGGKFLPYPSTISFDALESNSDRENRIVYRFIKSLDGLDQALERIRADLHWLIKSKETDPFFDIVTFKVVVVEADNDSGRVRNKLSTIISISQDNFQGEVSAVNERDLHSFRVLDGETIFRLYDTFGFPLDLTADIARERGITIDQAGF